MIRALAAAALLAAPGLALAAPTTCKGTISGRVTGAFECTVRVKVLDPLQIAFEIRPTAPVKDVPALAPGSFIIARPVRAITYTLDTLGPGRASVADDGTTLFTATKTSSQRGEVTLTLTSAAPGKDGVEELHGTYRAKLIPAGGGKKGEVTVEVTF